MVTRVIQYFHFPDKPMKGDDIVDFWKGWAGGGGYEPPYQLCVAFFIIKGDLL